MTLVEVSDERVAVLRSSEIAALSRCESVIETGLRTFVEVGNALSEIRDSRLYRQDFATFEDYCQSRWGFTRTQANRLVAASEVAATLPIGVTPRTESQARELSPLKDQPDRLREAWGEVQARAERDDRKVTAELVREVVSDFKPSMKLEAKKLGMNRRPTLHDAAVRVVTEAQQRGSVYHVPADAMRALMLAIGKEK